MVLRNATLPLLKASAVAGIALLSNVAATAQCKTFQNADAANPLLSVLDPTKKIVGFAFADIDGDGDQDVYVDYLSGNGYPYSNTQLVFFRNVGSKNHPVFKEDSATGFGHLAAGYPDNQMQFADVDGDGDLDFFISNSIPYFYYENSYIVYYKNVGTAKEPRFIPAIPNFLPNVAGTRDVSPFAFADVDGDGDLDFYTADVSYYGSSTYFQRVYFNIGNPQKPMFSNYSFYDQNDGALNRTYYDWNKDGLLDYFDIYNYTNYYVYYQNTGIKNDIPHYIQDNANGPKFTNGVPYRMIDLNNDGEPEVFTADAHYSTLAPVAVIQDTVVNNGSRQLTVLSSQNRSANYTYRWEYNGKTILAADNYYVVAKQPGIYTLYVSDECGIGVSLNDTLSENGMSLQQANDWLTALTNATTLPFAVKSYPNPFTNTFTLQLSGSGERAECMVKITDLAGRVFLSQRMSAPSVQLGQRLPRGTYTIQVWQHGELVYHIITMKE